MRVFALLVPSAIAVQVATPPELSTSHMHMKETLRAIAAQKQKDGKLDDDTRDAVRNLLGNITQQLEDALIDDKNDAQQMIDDASAAVNQTNDDCDAEVASGGDIFQAKADVDTAESNFDTCKQAECDLYDPWCDAYGEHSCHICAWGDIVELGTLPCTAVLPAGEDSDQLCECMTAWRNWQVNGSGIGYLDPYVTKREDVRIKKLALDTKTGECNGLQGTFEAEVCSAQDTIWSECDIYSRAYDAKHQLYNETKETVEDLEQTFKDQQCALEKLECYGRQILANETDLTLCADECEVCERCDALTIDYTPFEAKKDCWGDNKYSVVPCNAGFESQFYDEWDDTAYSNTSSCGASAHSSHDQWCNTGDKCPTTTCTPCSSSSAWIGQ